MSAERTRYFETSQLEDERQACADLVRTSCIPLKQPINFRNQEIVFGWIKSSGKIRFGRSHGVQRLVGKKGKKPVAPIVLFELVDKFDRPTGVFETCRKDAVFFRRISTIDQRAELIH